MASRPRIGIPVPTSFDEHYNAQSWPEYEAAVADSGGEPVRLELGADPDVTQTSIRECSGFVLPGSGADVDPFGYGHERQPETAQADLTREQTDVHILEHLERTGKPLLAICFGLQSLNVYRGGTLVQHLLPVPVNHRAGRAVKVAHAVLIHPDSHLGRVAAQSNPERKVELSEFARVMINSSHHQAVAVPGQGLRVVARSPEDAVIEALEDPSHPWMIGVQWHPERTMQESWASRELFRSFVEAAKTHKEALV